jgi:hypothetical protein
MASKGTIAAGTGHTPARRPVPDELRESIETSLRFGLTVDQVAAQLVEQQKQGMVSYAPAARTIRSWISVGKLRRPVSPDDPWSILHGRADDVPYVVPVLPVIASLEPAARWLSVREAEIVARVGRAAPDLTASAIVTLAVVYAGREHDRRPTQDLDLFLGFAPWRRRDDESEERHEQRKALYLRLASAAGTFGVDVDPIVPGRIRYAKTIVADIEYHKEDD